MEEDFYATLKLKSGEEIFAKVAASEENDRTMLLVSHPIVVGEIKNKIGVVGYKIEPWLKTTTDDMFILNMNDVLTMSIRQTLLLTSTTLLDIRVLHLMMQDSSIVLMFPSRWFAPLGRTPSNLKSALRPVMVLLLTPSQKEPLQAQVVSVSTATATIVALLLRTLCDPLVTRLYKTPFGGSFFCI